MLNNEEQRNHDIQTESAWELDLHTLRDSRDKTIINVIRRTDFFATDSSDEFQIRRENGEAQGIFKVWADHTIPVLENPRLNPQEAIEVWSNELRQNPLSLFESLEQWRAFSHTADRRLQQIFAETPVSEDPSEAIPELFARLQVAFDLGAPFYNIEALVADTRQERIGNPIDITAEGITAGKLDAVAMLLPAALKDRLLVKPLNWGELDWPTIDSDIDLMRRAFLEGEDDELAEQFVFVNNIAALAGIEPSTVLFAANALEFIPAEVGGKSDDMPQEEAISTLSSLLDQADAPVSTGSVAKDINALIRFLNWTPAFRDNENFSGKHWAYDAVCGTSAQLLELVDQNADTVFDPVFAEVFKHQLMPQLNDLDAASAKGRFLLQLLQESRFNGVLSEKIAERTASCASETLDKLKKIQSQEAIIDSQSWAPAALVGGKATGLKRAAQLFGHEKITEGQTITTEAVNLWLEQIEGFNELVGALKNGTSIEEKLAIADAITELIHVSEPPIDILMRVSSLFDGSTNHLIMRSTAFDEDVDVIGPAPGIYESIGNLNPQDISELEEGFKAVVASFFSDKATSFRELKGLRHDPCMAVEVQETIVGPGGAAFIKDGKLRLNVASSPDKINDITGETVVEEFNFAVDSAPIGASLLLSNEQLEEVITMARLSERVFGPTDIEFVIDPTTDSVRLLQLRRLERPALIKTKKTIGRLALVSVNDVANLPKIKDDDSAEIHIDSSINLDKFQGALFRWIVANRDRIETVVLENSIPATCHFVNVCESLGISVQSKDKS
jgi:hypothetical protein